MAEGNHDSRSVPGDSEDDRSVIVTGIPLNPVLEALKDKLEMNFQKQQIGGGDIARVEFLKPPTIDARITFCDPEVAKRILAGKTYSFSSTEVTVKQHDVERFEPPVEVEKQKTQEATVVTQDGMTNGSTQQAQLDEVLLAQFVQIQLNDADKQKELQATAENSDVTTTGTFTTTQPGVELSEQYDVERFEHEEFPVEVEVQETQPATVVTQYVMTNGSTQQTQSDAEFSAQSTSDQVVFQSVFATMLYQKIPLADAEVMSLVETAIRDIDVRPEFKDGSVVFIGDLAVLNEVNSKLIAALQSDTNPALESSECNELLEVIGKIKLDELPVSLRKNMTAHCRQNENLKCKMTENKFIVKGNLENIIKENEKLLSLMQNQGNESVSMVTEYHNETCKEGASSLSGPVQQNSSKMYEGENLTEGFDGKGPVHEGTKSNDLKNNNGSQEDQKELANKDNEEEGPDNLAIGSFQEGAPIKEMQDNKSDVHVLPMHKQSEHEKQDERSRTITVGSKDNVTEPHNIGGEQRPAFRRIKGSREVLPNRTMILRTPQEPSVNSISRGLDVTTPVTTNDGRNGTPTAHTLDMAKPDTSNQKPNEVSNVTKDDSHKCPNDKTVKVRNEEAGSYQQDKSAASVSVAAPGESTNEEGSNNETLNPECGPIFVEADPEILQYVFITRRKELLDIKANKVFITWDQKRDEKKVFISPKGESSTDDVRQACNKFKELMKSVRDKIVYRIIDLGGLNINSDKIREAKTVVDSHERKNKLVHIKSKARNAKCFKLLGEDDTDLDIAVQELCQKVGIKPPVTSGKMYTEGAVDKAKGTGGVAESGLSDVSATFKTNISQSDSRVNTSHNKTQVKGGQGTEGDVSETTNKSGRESPEYAHLTRSLSNRKDPAKDSQSAGNQHQSRAKHQLKQGPETKSRNSQTKTLAANFSQIGESGKDEDDEFLQIENLKAWASNTESPVAEMKQATEDTVIKVGNVSVVSKDNTSDLIGGKALETKAKHDAGSQVTRDVTQTKCTAKEPRISGTGDTVVMSQGNHHKEKESYAAKTDHVSVKESYDTLFYVFKRYENQIARLMSRNKTHIKWSPKDEREIVYIIPDENGPPKSALKTKEAFESFLKVVKGSLCKAEIDFSTVAKLQQNQEKDAINVLDMFDEKVVWYTVPIRKYVLLSDDSEKLSDVVKLVEKALGIHHKKALSFKAGDYDFPPSTEAKSADDEHLSKHGTVGQDMLAFLFHAHRDRLNDMERSNGVEFMWGGGEGIIIKPAKGNIKCTQQLLESVYEEFVSYVQSLHSKMVSKELDLTGKDVSSSITDAKRSTQRIFGNVLIKETEKKQFRILGEVDEVKLAMETFCDFLGVTVPPGRHGGRKRHGLHGVQRSNSDDRSDKTGKVLLQLELGGAQKTKISICRGDITKANVDAIANAANSRLSHGGGVAGAIVKAGGYSIQKESDDIIASRSGRQIGLSEVVYTKAGSLPSKWVLHAVGPVWTGRNEAGVRDALYRCCTNLLIMAEQLKARSIAIPAIGTGIYDVPKDICAEVMFDAMFDYLHNHTSSLMEIHFMDINDKTLESFVSVFSKACGNFEMSNYMGTDTTGRFRSKESSVDGSGYSKGTTSGYGSTDTPHSMESQVGVRERAKLWSNVVEGGTTYGSKPNSSHGAVPKAVTGTSVQKAKSDDPKDGDCAICLDKMKKPKTLPCKHTFCRSCMDTSEKTNGPICPICKQTFGTVTGSMPKGTMKDRVDKYYDLSGYPGCGCIVINYSFKDGVQGKEHPNPGKRYSGTSRTAYLPNNAEGHEVLRLLKIAFNRRLTFTIGTSMTTGYTDTVTWNEIHHKTSLYSGEYGYPDPGYLKRVKEELAAKGVK